MGESVYRKALDKWGIDAQLGVLQEECAEVIQAVSKYRRNPCHQTLNQLAEEIADVTIMLAQMGEVVGLGELITTQLETKRARLEEMLK